MINTDSQRALYVSHLQPWQALAPYNDDTGAIIINHQLAHYHFWSLTDYYWMQQALVLAYQGARYGEVPVGAVLIHDNAVIGQGFNQPISQHDATAHAEIVAIRDSCQYLNNYRLPLNTTLYVTLEPCTMCLGALIHARVSRVVFAASEPRAGMVGSQMDLSQQPFYNHHIEVQKGLCREPSSRLLKNFFRQRRKQAKLNRCKHSQSHDLDD